MALTNTERQQRFRKKVKTGELSRVDIKLPVFTAEKLDYLAAHWQCTKTDALSRCLDDMWDREGSGVSKHVGNSHTPETSTPSAKPDRNSIYQIRLTLIDVTPTVWRKLLVPVETCIAGLHHIVQIAMDWENHHLHRFMISGREYGISQIGGMNFHDDPDKVLLSDFKFQPGDSFHYEYNFGDLWKHELLIEDILTREPKKTYPVCIDGKQACPPEDAGGHTGYMYMLHVLKSKRHRDKRVIKEQIGTDFNPTRFLRGEVNSELRRNKNMVG